MRPEPNSSGSSSPAAAAATPSPSAKRSRDPEDEIYVDNLHSHKRYLSEIMASSLNGLTVGDSLSDHIMESPARSDSMFYLRDELSCQYSPMSEDSDDARYCEAPTPTNTCSPQADSRPTSPVSPYRYQKPLSGFSSTPTTTSSPSHASNLSSVACMQSRQRGSDSEGRYPSSPSDICHSADLRRAALLRSVQMRAHSPGTSMLELLYGPGQETLPTQEPEERPCSYVKPSIDAREYPLEECSPMGISEPELNHDKSGTVQNIKADESGV